MFSVLPSNQLWTSYNPFSDISFTKSWLAGVEKVLLKAVRDVIKPQVGEYQAVYKVI